MGICHEVHHESHGWLVNYAWQIIAASPGSRAVIHLGGWEWIGFKIAVHSLMLLMFVWFSLGWKLPHPIFTSTGTHHWNWRCILTNWCVMRGRCVCISSYFQSGVIDICMISSRWGPFHPFKLWFPPFLPFFDCISFLSCQFKACIWMCIPSEVY